MGDMAANRPDNRRHHRKTELLLTHTRGMLHGSGLRARKGLGQHFLVDEATLKLIVATAQLTPADIVMEIGPGLGVLTRELAKVAGRVLAVELDDNLAAILKQRLASFPNTTIINEDILRTDPAVLLRETNTSPSDLGSTWHYKVVANLPYYITSPVLRHFLEASVKPQVMVLMVQKEVAEQIVAKPGRMSLLAVSVQLYGEPIIIDYVPAARFYPVPEVDSAILKITLYPQPTIDVGDIDGFFSLVRAGFSAARKQMGNSLAHRLAIPKSDVLSLLVRAGIAPQRRAESLDLPEWARLWEVFRKGGESAC